MAYHDVLTWDGSGNEQCVLLIIGITYTCDWLYRAIFRVTAYFIARQAYDVRFYRAMLRINTGVRFRKMSVYLSLCPSITIRYYVKMAEHIVVIFTPRHSTFSAKPRSDILTGSLSTGRYKQVWWWYKKFILWTFYTTTTLHNLGNGARQRVRGR